MTITLHEGDLPAGLDFGPSLAIDTETMGLNPVRDRLCVVQMCGAAGEVHLVRFARGPYDAPRLRALLADRSVLKIFHFARFDLATLRHHLGVMPGPVYCTKMAYHLLSYRVSVHTVTQLRPNNHLVPLYPHAAEF